MFSVVLGIWKDLDEEKLLLLLVAEVFHFEYKRVSVKYPPAIPRAQSLWWGYTKYLEVLGKMLTVFFVLPCWAAIRVAQSKKPRWKDLPLLPGLAMIL